MPDLHFYERYWGAKTNPVHGHEDKAIYRLYAEELNLILGHLRYNQGPVYEVGCGDGSMFEFMKINKQSYVAKDLSEPMLDKFRIAHPDVNVMHGDGSIIPPNPERYGLIFGYGVHQNFSPKMLARHVGEAAELLQPGGILLLGSQPSKGLKYAFYSGAMHSRDTTLRTRAYGVLSLLNIPRSVRIMGYWHDYNSIKTLAKQHGLNYQVFGSVAFPYRVNISLKKN